MAKMTHSSLRSQVRDALERAWARAIDDGAISALEDDERPAIEVERPANPEHGDFASNLALKLARPYRRPPLELATVLAAKLVRNAADSANGSPIEAAEVAPPGFLNIRLRSAALEAIVDRILAEPETWGRIEPASPRKVNVEFVSANPTGPLHVGNARGAFVGDLLARVLEAGGQTVTREYYFNDAGGQMRNLGASVVAVRRGEPVPDDGYRGDYVADLAKFVPNDVWAAAIASGVDTADVIGRWAGAAVREGIEASLARLGVRFDVWTTESRLHDEGWVQRAVDRLRDAGDTYERDGAIWLASTRYGDDKDRPIFRSNEGGPTYLAADIGYLLEKSSRGFDQIVFIWGEDHRGYIARVKGAAESLGIGADRTDMKIVGWVRFVRDGVEISMSKRAGEFITLDELLGEVGVDAARWFFASRAATSAIDFDIELAKRQSNENPVYYVQYAHARIASILRKAEDAGLAASGTVAGTLGGGPEAALARQVVRLPEIVEDAVSAEETHGVTAYATELATAFHAFYRDARVVDPSEPERSAKRLALAKATQLTLARTLGLLGISAPSSM
jgi:arginyl-tRNA synthetase